MECCNTSPHALSQAEAWAKAFDNALVYLEENAGVCSLARENDYVDFEVRDVLFKTRRGLVYRILFTIRDDKVIILHVRGPGQDLIEAANIRNPR
jgi:hypothetical protein